MLTKTSAIEGFKGGGKKYIIPESRWQVLLFRSIKEGDLKEFVKIAKEHPEVIHDRFANSMMQYELEWESTKWFEFLDATAIYIASAYAQYDIIQWLIHNGSNPETICYCSQKAKDIVAQLNPKCNNSQREYIVKLLEQPRKPFLAPPKPSVRITAGMEEIVSIVYEERDGIKIPRRNREHQLKAKAYIDWRAYWLPSNVKGSGDEVEYQLRTRNKKDRNWSIESRQSATKIYELLPLNTTYEITVRVKNEAGWSAWSEICEYKTPEKATHK